MGLRGELYTERIFFQNGQKTFFFNVKENRQKDLFLNIVETRRKADSGFDRHSMMIYREDLTAFLKSFSDAGRAVVTGETWSDREIPAESGRRKYLFMLKSGRIGKPMLIITESRKGDNLEFQNDSIRLFEEQLEQFRTGLEKAAEFILSR